MFILLILIGVGMYVFIQKNTTPSFPIVGLSTVEYDTLKNEFIKLVNAHDPKFALQTLQERMGTNNKILRTCHSFTHDIGHAAYVKYGDFDEAVKFQKEICNSGYLHGVIESHFGRGANIEEKMGEVCSKYPMGKYLSWECFHGVGHGVMFYTSNNLPKSLELCATYPGAFAVINCINGVFMENFNTDQKLHPSKFLNEEDPFYPCREQPASIKGICYIYAPTHYLSLHKNDYTGALKWCDSAEFLYRDACASGTGNQTMKEHLHEPKFVESICMSGTSSQIAPCIAGMIGLFINNNGSLQGAEELCATLEQSNQRSCRSGITSIATLFE